VFDRGIDRVNGGVGHEHLVDEQWRVQRKYCEAVESSINLRADVRVGRHD
jgi:hypothetical protein